MPTDYVLALKQAECEILIEISSVALRLHKPTRA